MLDQASADDLLNATVYDMDDNKIGRVGRVYLDDRSGDPEWVTVQTGMFGTKESFLPLGQARVDGDRLLVPIAKDAVKNAPHIDPESGHLSVEEEQQLYRHYGLSHDDEETADADPPAADVPPVVGVPPAKDTPGSAGVDMPDSAPEGQARTSPPGMRLRRHLVTEEQQITVPVVREMYILEDDPGSDETRTDEPGQQPPAQR